MAKLWAWLVTEEGGEEGIVAALFPGIPGATPLVTSHERNVTGLGVIADLHAKATGKPVRLAVFEEVKTNP